MTGRSLVENRLDTPSFTRSLSAPTVLSEEQIKRPRGYEVAGHEHWKVSVTSEDTVAEGWGSGPKETAKIKATSEAFERLTMFVTNGGIFQSRTSSGWAAHYDSNSAIASALAELVERETALETWFNSGPYFEVPESFWPREIKHWQKAGSSSVEFHKLKVVFANGKNGGCVSVLLLNDQGGCVAGHASGADLQSALMNAFSEALRSAHATLRFESFNQVMAIHQNEASTIEFAPEANALAYGYGESLPCLEFLTIDAESFSKKWLRHQNDLDKLRSRARVALYEIGDRVVAQVFVPEMTEIFWGPTPGAMSVKNKLPHFVG